MTGTVLCGLHALFDKNYTIYEGNTHFAGKE
jgi:hypothetical protein